ncbi:hypothetical protein O3P69_011305 [Scylla paramamosain]|uniref:Uncharacterized protein n=1 Tax=Scylla paramamosain TaxID=85552 RepID=A0AAW0SGK2_SCYPA
MERGGNVTHARPFVRLPPPPAHQDAAAEPPPSMRVGSRDLLKAWTACVAAAAPGGVPSERGRIATTYNAAGVVYSRYLYSLTALGLGSAAGAAAAGTGPCMGCPRRTVLLLSCALTARLKGTPQAASLLLFRAKLPKAVTAKHAGQGRVPPNNSVVVVVDSRRRRRLEAHRHGIGCGGKRTACLT